MYTWGCLESSWGGLEVLQSVSGGSSRFLYSLCVRERIHKILTGIANSEEWEKIAKKIQNFFFTVSLYIVYQCSSEEKKTMVN